MKAMVLQKKDAPFVMEERPDPDHESLLARMFLLHRSSPVPGDPQARITRRRL